MKLRTMVRDVRMAVALAAACFALMQAMTIVGRLFEGELHAFEFWGRLTWLFIFSLVALGAFPPLKGNR